MLRDNRGIGQTYNLHGDTLTQMQLVDYLNQAFGTAMKYRELSVDEYRKDRIKELGEFIGTIIVGIYVGIRNGAWANASHFAKAAGRPHQN